MAPWEDISNYDKHIKDINNWLFDVQDVVIKPKSKSFKSQQYYTFLFEEQIKSKEDVSKKINGKLQNYHNLKVINTDEDVYNRVNYLPPQGR